MHSLELKIPPVAVGLAIAAAMWLAAHLPPNWQLTGFARIAGAVVLGLAGIAVAGGGVVAFRRASTTVNPLKPETSAVLVDTGVYAFTRNPMYLGMALVLLAWGVFLSSLWSLLGPLLFAGYITRFQIVPEERALEGLFGADFVAYKTRVRRWL